MCRHHVLLEPDLVARLAHDDDREQHRQRATEHQHGSVTEHGVSPQRCDRRRNAIAFRGQRGPHPPLERRGDGLAAHALELPAQPAEIGERFAAALACGRVRPRRLDLLIHDRVVDGGA